MTLNSHSRFIKPATLPAYAGRQYYMASTQGANVQLPPPVLCYAPEIQALCASLGYLGGIHVTIDESVVEQGKTQRKPGLHVDGRFTGTAWGHEPPGWNHYCNEIPLPRMAVAVTSSLAKCKVYHGQFDEKPNAQGDLSHIKPLVGAGKIVPAYEWHLLSPDCVHESLPFETTAERIFVRVAFDQIPGGF